MTHHNPEFRAFLDLIGLKLSQLYPFLSPACSQSTAWSTWSGRKRPGVDTAILLTQATQAAIDAHRRSLKIAVPLSVSVETLFPPAGPGAKRTVDNIAPAGEKVKAPHSTTNARGR